MLGEIAMSPLLADSRVATQLQEFIKHVDLAKLEAVMAAPATTD